MSISRPLTWGLGVGLAAALALAGCSYACPNTPECSGKRVAAACRIQPGKSTEDTDQKVEADTLADTDVLHYNLDIEVFPETEEIAGTNAMTVKSLVDGLTEFTFRLHSNFDVTSATVNGTTPVTIIDESATTRRARLDRPYAAGECFTLAITYEGSPPSMGFGSIQFRQHEGVDIVYSFSCPYYAYTWWPCKDADVGDPGDNADKATVTVAVTAPENLRTVSNGLLRGVETLDGGRKRYRWATSYPIATYLVAFSSTNYVTWTKQHEHETGSMPVEFNLYPEADTPETRAQLEESLTMLETFGRIFGPYPFLDEKFGIYQFEFGGGMEHQTNVGQGSFTSALTAHELSHQWWGDAITCRTWHDVWLNEGFATYSEALWEEFKPGSSGQDALYAWMAQRRPSSVADSVYVYDTSNVWRVFSDDFSYRKGAWVLHQLRHIVGDETFFAILTQYRKTFEGGAATTADFIATASAVHGEDLAWFFDQWVYGNGAPAYRYGWKTEQISGQHCLRLFIDQVQDPSWGTFCMPLDVCVDYAGGSETYVVFNDADPEHFMIPIPAAATDVALDQHNWVLHTSLEEVDYAPESPDATAYATNQYE